MELSSVAQRTRLIPVPDWNLHYPWPTVPSLRHLINRAESNGFDRVIRRVNGRILIDEEAFLRWVDEQDANFKRALYR